MSRAHFTRVHPRDVSAHRRGKTWKDTEGTSMAAWHIPRTASARTNVERGRKGNVCDVHETALIFESHPPAGFLLVLPPPLFQPPLDAE